MKKVEIKGLGGAQSVVVNNGATVAEVIQEFERVTGRETQGYDVYINGQKQRGRDMESPSSITLIKAKHESAA